MDAYISRTRTLVTALVAAAMLALGATLAGAATVTIEPGDTLSDLAARHGVTVGAIAGANGLADAHTIIAGRALTIPDGSASAPTSSSSSSSSSSSTGGYRVASGDTLSAIAARHGVSVSAVASANGLSDPNTIVAGRSLTIPAASAATTANASTPVPAGMVPVDRGSVGSMITSAATRHGVDPELARAIAWQESGWNHASVSSAGALGVMQLMPDTARWLGTDVMGRDVDPRSISDNIDGGVALLGWLQRETGGDTRTTIAAYYQGLAGVRQRGWFDDTKDYVESVLALRGRV